MKEKDRIIKGLKGLSVLISLRLICPKIYEDLVPGKIKKDIDEIIKKYCEGRGYI